MHPPSLKTKRLLLRPWQASDLAPLAAMNADPRVMEFFPAIISLEESKHWMDKTIQHFDKYGFGVWAATLLDSGKWIGFVGLEHVDFSAPFTPAVEIAWRLAFDEWGQGYATEGAKAVLQYGFKTLQLKEIVSFTAKQNVRSQRVMQRLGMHHDPKDDFDHPKLKEGHWLRRHVLYRLKAAEFRSQSLNQISLKPLAHADLPLLRKWLEEPHVKAFWDKDVLWTDQLVQAKYGSYVDGYTLVNGTKKQVHALIIHWGAKPIGYIQYYNAFDFPRDGYDLKGALKDRQIECRALAALDLFIGEIDVIGQGLGSLAIKQCLNSCIWPRFDACFVDPEITNYKAIKAYEKVGFRKIGTVGTQIQMMLCAQ